MLNHANRSWMGWVVLVVLFFATVPVLAQLPTGTIQGVVKDTSGGIVPGATVTIQNVETGQVRTTMTSDGGAYQVPALAVGRYTVRIEKGGFKTLTEQGLTLEVTQELLVNATLEVGTSSQQVTVTGEVPLVDTTTSSLGGLVNEDKVASLPLNGRNYVDLTLMQMGVTEHKNVTKLAGTAGTYFSSNGATVRSNNYLLDGASLVNFYGSNSGSVASTTLGVDGIKEYKVVTSGFSAEYGMTMGSQMVIVSKGGTNQYHGDAFEYLRNNVLDAANYFDKPIQANGFRRLPSYIRNNFGAAFGGPIKKDKTFFFGVYEGLRERLGTTTIDTVMSPGCHGGLGAVITVAACPEISPTASVTIGSISPAVAAWTASKSAGGLFPDPNLPGNQFTFPFTQPTREDYVQGRVDQYFGTKDTFFVRYTLDRTTTNRGRAYPEFLDVLLSKNQFATLSENHIFSQSLLGTARLSFSRTFIPTQTITAASVQGLKYSLAPGQDIGSVSTGSGITGFAPDPTNPSKPTQNIFTGSYDFFYTRGQHSLKFGTLINYYQAQGSGAFSKKGTISFANMADFLRGKPQTISGTDPNGDQQKLFLFDTFGFYLQDDLKATSRLTLNLGLRYEFMTDPREKAGKGVGMPNIKTDPTTTLGPVMANNTFGNFSPRVGFAWDVMGNGRTSIRGGFAYLYDLSSFTAALYQVTLAAPPYSRLYTITNPASFTVPFTIPPALLGTSARIADYNWRSPRMLEYNLTVERQLPLGIGLSVAYVGSRGNHYPSLTDGNPVSLMTTAPGPAAIGYGVVTNGIGCNGAATIRPNGTGCWGPSTPTCSNNVVPSCRINTNFTNIQLAGTSQSKAWYNALQVGATKRLAKGLQFQSSYTWSQTLDTTQGLINGDSNAGSGFVSDPTHPLIDKGPAQFDVTHNWRFNLLYHLPDIKSESFAAKPLKGWWLGSIFAMQTGYAYSALLNTNRSLSGVNGGGGGIDRADIVTSANLAAAQVGDPLAVVFDHNTVTQGNVNQWFNPHMFTLGPVGFLGTSSRNNLRGPGLKNLDFSINKDTPVKFLGEQGAVQFRAEIFNILNHPNFGMPSHTVFTGQTTVASQAPISNVGIIQNTANASRQVQLALKIVF